MGVGSPRGWGIKENHLHLSDSSNLKFLQDSLDTGAILLKSVIRRAYVRGVVTVLLLTRFLFLYRVNTWAAQAHFSWKVSQLKEVSVMNMNLGCGNQSRSVPSKRHRSLSGQICPLAHVPGFTILADEDSAPKGDIPPPKTLPVTNLFFFCLICSPRFWQT